MSQQNKKVPQQADRLSFQLHEEKGNEEELLENWYEEKIKKVMKDQDQSTYEGVAEAGILRDIKIELTKKISITIPVRSKDRDDVDEATKRLVKYIEETLKYEVHRVAHFGHGKKQITGCNNEDSMQNIRN